MRLIDTDELKKVPLYNGGYDSKNADPHFISGIRSVMEYIDNMPTVDAAPVVHAHWEGFTRSAYYGMDEYGEPIYRDKIVWYCSNPKCRRKTVIKEKYCPNCGGKMDEVVNKDCTLIDT